MRLRLLTVLIIPSLFLAFALSVVILLLHPAPLGDPWVRTIVRGQGRTSFLLGNGQGERWSNVTVFGKRSLALTDRENNTIRIIDMVTGATLREIATNGVAVGIDSDDTQMVTIATLEDSSTQQAVEIWDTTSGERLIERPFEVSDMFAFEFANVDERSYVIFGSANNPDDDLVDTFQVMNPQLGEYSEQIYVPYNDFTTVDLAANGDSLLMAAAGMSVRNDTDQGMVWLWSLDADGQFQPRAEYPLGEDFEWADGMDISADGSRLAYSATYGTRCPERFATLTVIDLESGESSALPSIERPLRVTFSPDGSRLAVIFAPLCDGDGPSGVMVIDLATGSTDILPHDSFLRVTTLRFSDDSQQLYSAAPNGAVMVWRLDV